MANAASLVSTWQGEYFADTFIIPVIGEDSSFDSPIYDVDPTINNKRIDYNVGELKYATRKKATCGFEANGSFDISERTLTVDPFAIMLEQCFDTFYSTAFRSKLKRGTDIPDMTGTFLQDLFEQMTPVTIGKDLMKHAWFGDTSVASTSFLSDMNGYFKILGADSSVGSYSLATTGSDLVADAALTTLREMWISEPILRGKMTQSKFLATAEVYDNLVTTYENTGTDSGLARLAAGGPLTFRGVEVILMDVWDEAITDFALSDPHRLVWTIDGNLRVGTDITDPRMEGKLFVDELQEKTYFKGRFDFGVQYRFSNSTAVALG